MVAANFARGKDTSRLSENDYATLASEYGLEVAHVKAFASVEAAGSGFWSSGNIKLLYEGHIAWRNTNGAVRQRLVNAGLAWPNWGAVAYGKAGVSRDRLRKAIEIAGPIAYRFASYGLGQVLGTNAKSLGYRDAKAMFDAFLTGERAQLDGMLRFLKVNKLIEPLKKKQWRTVAKGYNGPSYDKHNYHGRLKDAYSKFSGGKNAPDAWDDGVLTIGDRGSAVKELQEDLIKLGAQIEADGAFGRATAQAVKDFQRAHGLVVDGIVGRKTAPEIKDAVRIEPAIDEAMNKLPLPPDAQKPSPAPTPAKNPKRSPRGNVGGVWGILVSILAKLTGRR